jgi:hypothetical protein
MTIPKRPRDKETNPSTPPKVRLFYKPKEKLVEKNTKVPSISPSKEENKPMVDKLAPTQT